MSVSLLMLVTMVVGAAVYVRQRNVSKRRSNVDAYMPPSIG